MEEMMNLFSAKIKTILFAVLLLSLTACGGGGGVDGGDTTSSLEDYFEFTSTYAGSYDSSGFIYELNSSTLSGDAAYTTIGSITKQDILDAGGIEDENSLCAEPTTSYDLVCYYPNDLYGYKVKKIRNDGSSYYKFLVSTGNGLTEYDEVADDPSITPYYGILSHSLSSVAPFSAQAGQLALSGSWSYATFRVHNLDQAPAIEESGSFTCSTGSVCSGGLDLNVTSYDADLDVWQGSMSYDNDTMSYTAAMSPDNRVLSVLICPSGDQGIDHSGSCRIMHASRN